MSAPFLSEALVRVTDVIVHSVSSRGRTWYGIYLFLIAPSNRRIDPNIRAPAEAKLVALENQDFVSAQRFLVDS